MKRLKLELPNFIHRYRLCQVPAYGWQITLKMSVVRVSWRILNLRAPMISLERLKQELSNFIHR